MSRYGSHAKFHKGLHPHYHTEQRIKAEKGLFRADANFAGEHAGSLSGYFITKVQQLWGSLDGVLFDSRTHMLMQGMIPCIPGWHTDAATRRKHWLNGQPDIFMPGKAQHLLMVVDAGTGSLTEFLECPSVLLPETMMVVAHGTTGRNLYDLANERIEKGHAWGVDQAIRTKPKSGTIVEFDVNTWHRGTAATGKGWRFFIRASRYTQFEVKNEIRPNANVYLPNPTMGW